MTKPGYFDRSQKLFTMADVQAKLAQRTGKPVEGESAEGNGLTTANLPTAAEPLTAAATPAALEWAEPVKATQKTLDCRYEIRGARLKDALLYYAWSMQKPVPKLLGYPGTPEAARKLCQDHADMPINQP